MNPYRTGFVLAFFLLSAAHGADVVKVITKTTDRMIQLPGEFQPYQQVAIFAKVSGFVDKVNVDVGSMVKTGELLATLVAPELTAHRPGSDSQSAVRGIAAGRSGGKGCGGGEHVREAESGVGDTRGDCRHRVDPA
jgi:hypothetical protein